MKPEEIQTYMNTATAFSKLSKAKRKQVGAVLVTNTGTIIPGVNGTPSGTDNSCEDMVDGELLTKLNVIHAELNTILKCSKEGISTEGATLFVSLSPCLQCAAMLKQAGVKKVYYNENYRDFSGIDYLKQNGVQVEQI